MAPAAITIDIDPIIHLGPLSVAWHGLTIAIGIALGTAVATRFGRRRELDPDLIFNAVVWMTVAGIAGARLVFLAENDAAALIDPGEWFGSRGFSFYGGLVFGAVAATVVLRRGRNGAHALPYLDAMAFGFPLAMAVGRIGDVINGEHYGPVSDAPWAIRYVNPEADVPSGDLAYHSGGLYEVVLALALAAVVPILSRRLRRPGQLLWAVVGLYGLGRFAMFFYRSDSPQLAFGLDTSQALSLALIAVACVGLVWGQRGHLTRRRRGAVGTGVVLVVAAVVAAGCGGSDDDSAPGAGADDPVLEDPGPVHVHGLGVDPRDGALFIATHTGLFRAPDGQRKAKRVAGRYQDTMAFTVTGPNRFLGSGHPDGREDLPPFLGLIESRDAGRSWKPVSLQGKADFHLLEVAGRRVYGFGSDFESREARFMVSENRGRTWSNRRIPEPFISLAVDPGDRNRLVAAGEGGLHRSTDGGRTWRSLRGRPGLLAWAPGGRLYLAEQSGAVSASADSGGRWDEVGRLAAAPSAFDVGGRAELLAALHDGRIERSTDGGATWTLRSAP